MKSLDEIQEMVDALPDKEWRFDKVEEDALSYTGAIRTLKGQNIVEPAAESASMVHVLKPVANFLTEAPVLVQQLIDTIRANNDAAPKSVESTTGDEDSS